MNYKKERRLIKLAQRDKSLSDFIRHVSEAYFWYGVPFWSKKEYSEFYLKHKMGDHFLYKK